MNFKVGDKIICTCGRPMCKPPYTIKVLGEDGIVEAVNVYGEKMTWNLRFDEGIIVTEAVYNSPLYKALS